MKFILVWCILLAAALTSAKPFNPEIAPTDYDYDDISNPGFGGISINLGGLNPHSFGNTFKRNFPVHNGFPAGFPFHNGFPAGFPFHNSFNSGGFPFNNHHQTVFNQPSFPTFPTFPTFPPIPSVPVIEQHDIAGDVPDLRNLPAKYNDTTVEYKEVNGVMYEIKRTIFKDHGISSVQTQINSVRPEDIPNPSGTPSRPPTASRDPTTAFPEDDHQTSFGLPKVDPKINSIYDPSEEKNFGAPPDIERNPLTNKRASALGNPYWWRLVYNYFSEKVKNSELNENFQSYSGDTKVNYKQPRKMEAEAEIFDQNAIKEDRKNSLTQRSPLTKNSRIISDVPLLRPTSDDSYSSFKLKSSSSSSTIPTKKQFDTRETKEREGLENYNQIGDVIL